MAEYNWESKWVTEGTFSHDPWGHIVATTLRCSILWMLARLVDEGLGWENSMYPTRSGHLPELFEVNQREVEHQFFLAGKEMASHSH